MSSQASASNIMPLNQKGVGRAKGLMLPILPSDPCNHLPSRVVHETCDPDLRYVR
jgi:hypothetical protein